MTTRTAPPVDVGLTDAIDPLLGARLGSLLDGCHGGGVVVEIRLVYVTRSTNCADGTTQTISREGPPEAT
jgi:hypothetical protein